MEITAHLEKNPIDLLIKEKLHTLTEDKNKTIRKVFKLSVEEMQDNPRKVYTLIRNYIKQYEDKIEDFWFDSYIEEETFAPILVLHVLPIESIRNHLTNNHWLNVVNLNVIPFIVEEKILEIFQRFTFEFIDLVTRKHIFDLIEQLLKFYTEVKFHIEDNTSNEHIEKEEISLLVISEYGSMTLKEFLFFLSEKNMFRVI